MSSWVEWLDREIGPLRAGRRVLVLCRTRATLSLVRRWAARRGGVLGLEATTPLGLAQQVLQEPILAGPRGLRLEPDALPPETAIGRRVGGRPGLAGVARRWAQHVRLAERVGARVVVPAWLRELVEGGFGVDEYSWALEQLLAAIDERGKHLSGSATWDRVVALGFDRPGGAREPHEDWLVARLTKRSPPLPEPSPGPIRAIRVPDVTAEARVAVRYAARDPDRTLILVSDLATARRVRDAASRSGIPCAWRDSEALAVHELASAVARCAPWFAAAPDPAIPLADLNFVLSRTALGRALHPAAEAAVAAFTPDREPSRPSRSSVKAVLERTRLLDAPLSGWRARVREQLPGKHGPDAAAVLVRLELLHAALTSRPVDEVLNEALGTEVAFDPDDFDDVIATLLGDERPATAFPAGDRLGAVQRFLLACRVRIHDDPVARAIVGALRDRAEWPVTPSHVHHALAGAIDLGVLSDGIDVITVDDYDDRPCGLLVVLDVHDHGLTRRPTPDPLLEDPEITALGALSGRAQVDARLAQVHRAVARAGDAVAVVTRRDANGREVVPPIQLDLRWEDHPVPSYGIGLPGLPEAEPRLLRSVLHPAAPPGPARHPDPVVRHLADQATAEWYREGRGPPTFDAPPDPRATLADLRRAELPFAPAHLLPYLGYAEQVPEAGLPSGPQSVSRLIVPLSHCGYQAFARVVLRIDERREIADDLDPAEVGTAVHQALEQVTPDARWRGSGVDLDALVERLRQATDRAFAKAIEGLGLSLARRTSVEGHRDRWNGHWRLYVESRALAPANPGVIKVLQDHPELPRWVDLLRSQVPALADGSRKRIAAWLVWAVRTPPTELLGFHPTVFLQDGEWYAMPGSALPDLQGIVGSPDWARLHGWFADLSLRIEAWQVAPHSTAAEVPFGEHDEPQLPVPVGGDVPEGTTLGFGPTSLKLGQGELPLRGRIDRLDFVRTPAGRPFVGVVDYKTGKARAGWSFRSDQWTLKDPQLLVYAMVVERAAREGRLPDALRDARVSAVAHDRVRQAVVDPESAERKPKAPETWLPVDTRLLAWAASQLGVLVDDAREGRWTLRPRADTCPMLASWSHDYCPVARACRLRGLADGKAPTPEDP